jgi:hypothetical protein
VSEEALGQVIGKGARARLLLVKMFTPMVKMLVRKHSIGVATTDLADMAGEGETISPCHSLLTLHACVCTLRYHSRGAGSHILL